MTARVGPRASTRAQAVAGCETEDWRISRSGAASSFASITVLQKEVTPSHLCTPSHHGLEQCRAPEIDGADRLQEDTAVLRSSRAHLNRMFHRALRAVRTVVTPGRFVPPNTEHERTKVAVSDDDLRQTKREDAVGSPVTPLFWRLNLFS